MTIKWHKISKKLPPSNTQALWAVNLDYKDASASTVELGSITPEGWFRSHYYDYPTPLDYFTHWALIDLPGNKQ